MREPAESIPREDSEARRCRQNEQELLAQQYFSALLLNGFFDLAAQYADRMVDYLSKRGSPLIAWREKRADAAFFAGDWVTAGGIYQTCASESPSALLKLADVAFKLGDLAGEKSIRERIYGSLKAPY